MSTLKQSVSYISPSKSSNHFKSGSPQVPALHTSRDTMTRRVWIKRPDGNPTSLQVKETHLIDDLKMMIFDKFPTTLAKICDPSDIIIKLDSGLASTNTYGNSPTTPLNKKFFAPPVINLQQVPSTHSPLSPIPIPARQSSLIQPKISSQWGDYGFYPPKTALSPSSTVSVIEPDRTVWSVLDTYYPSGQGLEGAFIVDIPVTILAQAQNTTNSSYPYSQGSQHPAIKKSFSSETIYEGKEDDIYSSTNRKLSSVPNQIQRIGTPSGAHRRTQSNPAEHASAVLLLPSAETKNKHNITNAASPQNSTMSTDEVVNEKSSNSETKKRLSETTGINNGKSTMAKVLPSISVLVVEDNLINLRILATHLKRHRIHYDVAKNGKEALDKWRKGGFHLVLMDIQLPVMSGLDASREIRRLEKTNHIGVFSNSDLMTLPPKTAEDALDVNVFRSPVIIVALTASNLNQDKQDALAAGCNDYLTKPVNLDWLLNKIAEWGCMQALIDFDGWKSGERMTNISAAIPALTRNSSSARSKGPRDFD